MIADRRLPAAIVSSPGAGSEKERLVIQVPSNDSRGTFQEIDLPSTSSFQGNSEESPLLLLSQLELNIADADNVASLCHQSLTRWLIVYIRAIDAARILNVPDAVVIPQARMLAGNEIVR